MIIPVTIRVHKDTSSQENPYIAHCLEFNIASAGKDEQHALYMVKEALELFSEGVSELGTLQEILEEANYQKLTKLEDGEKVYKQHLYLKQPLKVGHV